MHKVFLLLALIAALALGLLSLVTFASIERSFAWLGLFPETRLARSLGLSLGPFGRALLYAVMSSMFVAVAVLLWHQQRNRAQRQKTHKKSPPKGGLSGGP